MWFCYVRGSFVPEPLQSLNTGVFFSEHSLETPRALRSSHQVRVWEGGQSLGALRGEPDPVLWCPSSWGPRALEEARDAVRPSPALPFVGPCVGEDRRGSIGDRASNTHKHSTTVLTRSMFATEKPRPLAKIDASFQT